LLLVSPLKETEILAGQVAALARHFGGWLRMLVFVNLAMSSATILFSEQLSMNGSALAMFQELFFGGILALVLDFKTLGHVGMWMALRANRHHRAVLGTLGRVLLPSWAGIFLMVFFMSQMRAGSAFEAGMIFASWFALGIVVDVVMVSMARRELRQGFRARLAIPETTKDFARLPTNRSGT
jgi:hypothetical protein